MTVDPSRGDPACGGRAEKLERKSILERESILIGGGWSVAVASSDVPWDFLGDKVLRLVNL